MGDIFSDFHKAKIIADEKSRQKAEHEKMIERATKKGNDLGKPKPVERPFVPSKPFWMGP